MLWLYPVTAGDIVLGYVSLAFAKETFRRGTLIADDHMELENDNVKVVAKEALRQARTMLAKPRLLTKDFRGHGLEIYF